MNPVGWMTAASALSWLVAAAFVEPRLRLDVLVGMLGPLVAVVGSWMLAERTYRQRPEALTGVMMAAFAFKIVFFGAYVAIALRVLAPRSELFVVSFVGYFTGLYVMQALYLRRLFR